MGPGQDRNPWILIRLAFVARHVTDCAMWPDSQYSSVRQLLVQYSEAVVSTVQ